MRLAPSNPDKTCPNGTVLPTTKTMSHRSTPILPFSCLEVELVWLDFLVGFFTPPTSPPPTLTCIRRPSFQMVNSYDLVSLPPPPSFKGPTVTIVISIPP